MSLLTRFFDLLRRIGEAGQGVATSSEAETARRRREKIYESHIAQIRRVEEFKLAITDRFERWILTLSGGALLGSITFIEKIAPNPLKESLPWVMWVWILFGLSLMGGFWSLYLSIGALERHREILDAEYDRRMADPPRVGENVCECQTRNRRVWWICKLNILSLLALSGGVFCLIVFATLNLDQPRGPNAPTATVK
jgi:hypothetical protein